MNEDISAEWFWPVNRDAYDSQVALSEAELFF